MIYCAYFLSALWSVGCVVIPLWAGFSLVQDRCDRGLGISVLLVGFPLGCLFAMAPWAFIADIQSPNLATLKKGQWVCSQSHQVTSTTYVKSGSVLVPVTNTNRVCDQYRRTHDDMPGGV